MTIKNSKWHRVQFREKKYVMANTGYLKQVSYLYTGVPEQQRRSRHL